MDRVELNVETFDIINRTQLYGSPRACSGFWGHHWSNILFLSDDSLVFGHGDHSVDFTNYDAGDPLGDKCYNTAAG